MQAWLAGELTIDDHGCFAVRAPAARAYPVLLPADRVFSGYEPSAIEVIRVPLWLLRRPHLDAAQRLLGLVLATVLPLIGPVLVWWTVRKPHRKATKALQ